MTILNYNHKNLINQRQHSEKVCMVSTGTMMPTIGNLFHLDIQLVSYEIDKLPESIFELDRSVAYQLKCICIRVLKNVLTSYWGCPMDIKSRVQRQCLTSVVLCRQFLKCAYIKIGLFLFSPKMFAILGASVSNDSSTLIIWTGYKT